MTNTLDSGELQRSRFRKSVYAVLCAASIATMCGRIVQVQSSDGKTPFLSANDRSRWCTIRAIVDEGTYAIDDLHTVKGWHTIDKVRHTDASGEYHFYSSKPTLFPTMLAGQYWLVKQSTRRYDPEKSAYDQGVTIAERPFYIARIMLVLTNVVPMLLYFVLLAALIEKWGTTDYGRIFTMAVATFGTFLTTFAITLNNHLPAAISVMLALWAANEIWYENRNSIWLLPLAGLGAAFAAANELPALSFLVMLGFGLLLKIGDQTFASCCLAIVTVIVVVAGFFGTNYIAHDDFRPPYMHRSEDNPADNWYAYPGSYWTEEGDKGIDNGEPSRRVYAFNALVGHHGVLSLTPVWGLGAIGILLLIFGSNRKIAFVLLVVTLTTVCFAFYVTRPIMDRNYGGMTCGFRWLFWLIPMWLLALQPAADFMARNRFLRGVSLVLLSASVFSATYATLNPWSHPWIYQYWKYIEWI